MVSSDALEEKKQKLQAAIDEIQEEINAQYWRFCRCARANPPNGDLYIKRNKLKDELDEIKRQSS